MILNIIGLILAIISPLFGVYGYIVSIAYSVLVIVVGFWSKKENKPPLEGGLNSFWMKK